nr:MAG TPA: Integrin alpha-V, Integrin beta-3 DOMAIN, PSI, EGF REPEATS [Caudoviricetes sp.]
MRELFELFEVTSCSCRPTGFCCGASCFARLGRTMTADSSSLTRPA